MRDGRHQRELVMNMLMWAEMVRRALGPKPSAPLAKRRPRKWRPAAPEELRRAA